MLPLSLPPPLLPHDADALPLPLLLPLHVLLQPLLLLMLLLVHHYCWRSCCCYANYYCRTNVICKNVIL